MKRRRPCKHIRRYKSGKRTIINKHIKKKRNYGSSLFKSLSKEPKKFPGRFEPIRRKEGKKTKLMKELEDTEFNLNIEGLSQQRIQELEEKKDKIEQKLKRTQGAPPIMPVREKTERDIQVGLINRYEGTSGRRPKFVDNLVDIPGVNPLIKQVKKKEAVKKAIEANKARRASQIAQEKAVVIGDEGQVDVRFDLAQLTKFKQRGRKKKGQEEEQEGFTFGMGLKL